MPKLGHYPWKCGPPHIQHGPPGSFLVAGCFCGSVSLIISSATPASASAHFCAKPQMLHCHHFDHISTCSYSMPSVFRFTLSSSSLLLLRALVRPFFLPRLFIHLSRVDLVLETQVVVLVLSLRELLSHILDVIWEHDLQQDCLHRLVVFLTFRVLFHTHLSCVCLQSVRILSRSLALLAWGGDRAFGWRSMRRLGLRLRPL